MAALLPRLYRAAILLALVTGDARAQCADEIAACTADSDCVGCYSARKASNEPAWLQCMAAYEDDEDPDTGVCAALKISCCLHELSLPALSCMTNGAFVDYARCVAGSSSGLACPASWSSCRGVDIGPVATTPPTASSSTLAPVAAETPPPTTAPVAPPVVPPTDAPVAPPTPAPVRPRTAAPVAPPTPAPVRRRTAAPVAPPTAAPVRRRTAAPVAPPTPAPVRPRTAAPVAPPTPAPVRPRTPVSSCRAFIFLLSRRRIRSPLAHLYALHEQRNTNWQE